MAQDETHNKTRIQVWATLRRLLDEHPDARIITNTNTHDDDLELSVVVYHAKQNTIELCF